MWGSIWEVPSRTVMGETAAEQEAPIFVLVLINNSTYYFGVVSSHYSFLKIKFFLSVNHLAVAQTTFMLSRWKYCSFLLVVIRL